MRHGVWSKGSGDSRCRDGPQCGRLPQTTCEMTDLRKYVGPVAFKVGDVEGTLQLCGCTIFSVSLNMAVGPDNLGRVMACIGRELGHKFTVKSGSKIAGWAGADVKFCCAPLALRQPSTITAADRVLDGCDLLLVDFKALMGGAEPACPRCGGSKEVCKSSWPDHARHVKGDIDGRTLYILAKRRQCDGCAAKGGWPLPRAVLQCVLQYLFYHNTVMQCTKA